MSFRVWISGNAPPVSNHYDWFLLEFGGDLGKLAAASAWKLPLRLFSDDRDLLERFLGILDEEYAMTLNDISTVKLNDIEFTERG